MPAAIDKETQSPRAAEVLSRVGSQGYMLAGSYACKLGYGLPQYEKVDLSLCVTLGYDEQDLLRGGYLSVVHCEDLRQYLETLTQISGGGGSSHRLLPRRRR